MAVIRATRLPFPLNDSVLEQPIDEAQSGGVRRRLQIVLRYIWILHKSMLIHPTYCSWTERRQAADIGGKMSDGIREGHGLVAD